MKSYKPRISEEKARELLTIRGKIFRSKKTAPLKVELIHLPYYFFKVCAANKKRVEKKFLAAVDGVIGTYVMVDDQLLEPEEILQAEFSPATTLDQARETLLKEAKWVLFQKATRNKEEYLLKEAGPGELAWYPFWVAYYKNKKGAWGFLGLDAISGALQAGKARRIFIHAFSA